MWRDCHTTYGGSTHVRQTTSREMCYAETMTDKRPQSDKFKEAARELEADEDEGRWEERLKKVVKGKPEKPE